MQFKIQDYQAEAAHAVTGVFEGLPHQASPAYLHDLGQIAGEW